MTTVVVDPTGTDDHLAIAAAIASVEAGDTVALSAGTFACAGDIAVAAGVNLAGTADTVLLFPGDTGYEITAAGANVLQGLDLRGGVMLTITGGGVACTAITSRQRVYGWAAFRISISSGTIDTVSFVDCHAIDTSGFGFLVLEQGTAPATVKNVTFSGCTATNCGQSNDCYTDASHPTTKDWITGFDFAEGGSSLTIENVIVEGCTASGCWESGFHCETGPSSTNCTITNCTSTGNGVKPSAVYGAGFLFPPGWTIADCVSTGDVYAYYIAVHPANPDRAAVPVVLTRCDAVDWDYRGFSLVGLTDAPLTAVTMNRCTARAVRDTNQWLILDDVTGAQILDFTRIGCADAVPVESGVSANNTITYYLPPFTVSIPAPVTGEAVLFTDRSVNDAIVSRSWDFGDGDGSTAQHPTHVYPTAGVYPVTLAAGGNTVSGTVTVRPGVSYGGARLSEADLAPLDHDPVANATDLQNGRVGLQGSPVSRRAWTINALTDDHAEIEALAALKGQHLVLNINGTEYPGTMIRPPLLETQLTPAAWAYQVGFVQETRR